MANAIATILGRARDDPQRLQAVARAEAERLFATGRVCEQISIALERLVARAT
jgi:hypothetical protein